MLIGQIEGTRALGTASVTTYHYSSDNSIIRQLGHFLCNAVALNEAAASHLPGKIRIVGRIPRRNHSKIPSSRDNPKPNPYVKKANGR
jgi:hypothetical protein